MRTLSKVFVAMVAVVAVMCLATAPANADPVSSANNMFIDFNTSSTAGAFTGSPLVNGAGYDPASLGDFITESGGAITGADLAGAQLRNGMQDTVSHFAYYSEYGGDNRTFGNAGQPYYLANDPTGAVFGQGPYPVNNRAVGGNGIELNMYAAGTTTASSRNDNGPPDPPGTGASDLSGSADFATARGATANQTGLTALGDDYIFLQTGGTTFPSGTGPSEKQTTVKIGGLSGGTGAMVNNTTIGGTWGPYDPGTALADGAYSGLAANSTYRVYLWGYVSTQFNQFGGYGSLDNTGQFSEFGFYNDPTDPTSGLSSQQTTSLANKYVTFDFNTGATVSDDLFLQWGIPAGQWSHNAAWNGIAFIQTADLTGGATGGGVIPEPSSFALWVIGVLGLGIVSARRRRLRA